MKENFISVLDYQDLSSKSLKHNRDPKRRVGMAALHLNTRLLLSTGQPLQHAAFSGWHRHPSTGQHSTFQILEQA